jgi:DeoR/GlpR family transcriptional regulator of sugar metabolism
MTEESMNGSRRTRQQARQVAITEAVVAEGSIRIERLAEMFETSVMTIHRDLDELEARGLLRKSRGVATAASTMLVESSDVYRLSHQAVEKNAIAAAAAELVEPGQAIVLDDSTTVLRMAPHLEAKEPLTVITNVLSLMNELRGVRGITMIGIGGQYYNWCSAFMGPMTTQALAGLHADTAFLSTSAITKDVAYHQFIETIETKRAMLASANRRVLLVDHTKFERQALHALAPLTDFDTVIVDDGTHRTDIDRMRDKGIQVIVVTINRPPRRRGSGRRKET